MKVKAPTEMMKALVTFNIAVCTCYNCNIPSLNKLSLSLSLNENSHSKVLQKVEKTLKALVIYSLKICK